MIVHGPMSATARADLLNTTLPKTAPDDHWLRPCELRQSQHPLPTACVGLAPSLVDDDVDKLRPVYFDAPDFRCVQMVVLNLRVHLLMRGPEFIKFLLSGSRAQNGSRRRICAESRDPIDIFRCVQNVRERIHAIG